MSKLLCRLFCVSVAAAAPVFIDTPSDAVVVQGGTGTFQCRATGYPIPSISWRKIGSSTIINGSDTVFSMSNVQRDSTGVYVCRAANSYGIVESYAKLTVYG